MRVNKFDLRKCEYEYLMSKHNVQAIDCRSSNQFLFKYDPIKKVIYNAPKAVIVYWKDGEKTVVKCGENDTWDPEKGLAMAIAKKFLGNKGNYNNILKKHLMEEKNI